MTGKLSLEFDMMGMWTQPFGFEYLAFGNLHLGIGISVGVPIPSFGELLRLLKKYLYVKNMREDCIF